FVILAREEAILTEWARSARVAESTAAEKAAGTPLDAAAIIAGGTFPSWPRRLVPRPQAIAYLAAAAASILLAVIGIALSQHWKNGAPAFLADLEEVQGDVFIVTPGG